MNVKQLRKVLEKMPDSSEVFVFIEFKKTNCGEMSDIKNICMNGPDVQLSVICDGFREASKSL